MNTYRASKSKYLTDKSRVYFCILQWCTTDQRCNRLLLNDLLVAPMQHCTKFPLLLSNIRKYTQNLTEQELLSELVEKVEFSLSKWLYQKFKSDFFLNSKYYALVFLKPIDISTINPVIT